MKRIACLILVIALITGITTSGYAQNPPVKLGRGILNTLTGFWEVPSQMLRTCKNEGVPKGLTIGLAKGIAWGLYRTVAGLYEIVTFVIPIPFGYEPITDPAILLTEETLEMDDPAMRGDFRPLEEEISGKSGRRSTK